VESPQSVVARFEAAGREPHRRHLMRAWLAGKDLDPPPVGRGATFPRWLLERLPALQLELEGLARVVAEHPAGDGSRRLLFRLADGLTVEGVLLARGALCVSTQVGCAVGCRFCRTGQDGLLRQLSPAEILAQVAAARRLRAVRRVVLMGMGEPAHNLEAVLEALAWLGSEGRIAHKDLVFSTVGDRRAFERLSSSAVKPALALSLHTTDALLRERLLPRAPRIAPAELVELSERYARLSGHPVQVQWTLLEGVNDTDLELERLAALLAGRRAIVNFIPYNPVEGSPFRRPPIERCVAMVRTLKRAGVLATLRRSGGQDVEAACGQLRVRESTSAMVHHVPLLGKYTSPRVSAE